MAQCPKCLQQVDIPEKYFGTLFNCPLCSAVYFIDWNGFPEITSATSEASEEEAIASVAAASGEIETNGTSEINENAVVSTELLNEETPVEAFKEITDYANSDVVVTSLTYNIFLTGIDTKEIRKDIYDVLSDSRFGWNVDELMQSIEDGQLTIEKINPVKASILVNRIKYLSIQIQWSQNVLK